MNKKKYSLISFGGGQNQIKLIIGSIKRKIETIVIEYKKIKICSVYIKQVALSCYNLTLIKKNINKIKVLINHKNIDIIYRSSGPSILVFLYLCKALNINRVSKELAYSVYSKSYFSKILKKHNLPFVNFLVLKKFKKIKKFKRFVAKPDSPIVGKQNVFLIDSNFLFNKKIFNKTILSSHNKSIICSDFIEGYDIGIFVLISKKKELFFLNPYYENNIFKKNIVKSYRTKKCTNVTINKKIIFLTKKIIKLYPNYYGFLSISYRVSEKNIIPYEINIGLSGDKIAERYKNDLSKTKNLFDLEIDNLVSN